MRKEIDGMTFNETLYELMKQTDTTEVYACRAYDDINGKCQPSIGIRRCIVGQQERDPVIDGTAFMICGDVYDIFDYVKLTSVDELKDADGENLSVHLRAVAGSWPIITADIGTYNILRKEIVDSDTVKLYLRRR